MNNKNKRISHLFTILFIISIIYTTLRLFSLQDDLILSSQALNSSEIANLSPVLFHLYIAVGIMILSGIITLVLIFGSGVESVDSMVFNDKNKISSKTEDKTSSEDKNKDESQIDLTFVKDSLTSKNDDKEKYSAVLNALGNKLELGQGAIYTSRESKGISNVEFITGYAFNISETETISFEFGEGLVGQAAKEGEMLVINEVPENYINIISGLGSASPNHLLILPLVKGKKTHAVVELASFAPFSKENINLIKESFKLLEKKEPESPKKAPTKKVSAEKASKKE